MARRLTRRSLLRGAGGATLGLPFLSAMLAPRNSWATDVPQRMVVFFSSNGTIPDAWRPVGTETNFTLSPILSPLARHQSDLVIVEGVDQKTAVHASGGSNGHDIGTGHCLAPWSLLQGPSGVGEFGHLWDGSAGGISFDQHLANALGGSSRFSSLVYGVACDISQAIPARISWRGPFDAVRPMQNPGQAFDRVFGSGVTETTSLYDFKQQRLSVIDAVLGDYNRLMADLGYEDRQRVERHVESIRNVERSIERLDDFGDCTVPTREDAWQFRDVGRLNLDMMVAAMACELTPVTVMQWGSGQSYVTFDWLGHQDGHHTLSHEPPGNTAARDDLIEINTWYAGQMAELIDRMKLVDAGDGTSLFDNSIILWVNELGLGETHTRTDVPYVLAGSGGGALQTGRYLDYRSDPDAAHGELFTALLNAMGVPDTTFGIPQYCRGPLAGLLGV